MSSASAPTTVDSAAGERSWRDAAWTRWAAPLLLLVAAAFAAREYFNVPKTREDARRQVQGFYPELRWSWLSMDETRLRDGLRAGALESFDLMVVRTALRRWRLHPLSTHPFDRIMERYTSGWWSAPNRESWEKLFSDLDAQWLARRVAFVNSGAMATPRLGPRQPSDILFSFPEIPDTAQLGSVLEFEFVVPTSAVPNAPVRLLWGTRAAPFNGFTNRQMALVKTSKVESPGLTRITLAVDMSSEPLWLAEGGFVTQIMFFVAQADSFQFIALRGKDHPLLPLRKGR